MLDFPDDSTMAALHLPSLLTTFHLRSGQRAMSYSNAICMNQCSGIFPSAVNKVTKSLPNMSNVRFGSIVSFRHNIIMNVVWAQCSSLSEQRNEESQL